MSPAAVVHILRSEEKPWRYYTGVTSDLEARLASHNAGHSTHTATGRPWTIVTFVAFADAARAEAFEAYLKSGSGRAFAIRHFR